MKILICGHRAYAARNLVKKLEAAGHEVYCFSRGDIKMDGNVVTGPVAEIDKNPLLEGLKADVVVNFILLDGQPVEDNLRYVDALCRWCEQEGVKSLVHMSSISALPNEAEVITEDTPVDAHPELKGSYGAVKVVVDNRLIAWAEDHKETKLIMVRPGFITAPDKKNALAGIAKMLPFGFAVLMGDNQSTLPLCERDHLQTALQHAIESENPRKVYLLVEEGESTKRSYLLQVVPNAKVIPLPKGLVMLAAKTLKTIGVFDEKKYQMVAGQFKVQKFRGTKYENSNNR